MHLFTYGTLMLPDIFTAVTGKPFPSANGRLYHYARYCVKGETYPGILPEAHAVVDGVVYWDVDNTSLHKLDRFEGGLYVRSAVIIHLADGTEIDAQTYIVRPQYADFLTSEPWSLKKFTDYDKEEFIAAYAGFARKKD